MSNSGDATLESLKSELTAELAKPNSDNTRILELSNKIADLYSS